MTLTATTTTHQSSTGHEHGGSGHEHESSTGQLTGHDTAPQNSRSEKKNESIDILELLLNDSVSSHAQSAQSPQTQNTATTPQTTTPHDTANSTANLAHNNPFAAAVHAQLEVQHASQGGVDAASATASAKSNNGLLMLPSEPQVMRTKRLGHRKASSVSYLLPASSPSTAAHTSQQQQQQQIHSLSSAHSNYSTYHQQQAVAFAQSANQSAASYTPSHNRTNSLTGIQDLNPDSVTDFLSFAQASYPQSASNSPPDSGMDHHLQQQQFNQQHQQHVNGHRRFHSMGNIVGPYAFPQTFYTNSSANANPSAPSFTHQKSVSGTSSMFDEFNSLNVMSMGGGVGKEMPTGMRPLRRLHPEQDQQQQFDVNQQPPQQYNANSFPSYYAGGVRSGGAEAAMSNMYQSYGQQGQEDMQDLYFDDETGMAEDGFRNGDDDYDQVITMCSWEGCNLEKGSQEALVNHILQDHVGVGKASYVCEWAGCSRLHKPFTKRHKIQNHVRIHTGERPFPCPVADCGKKFSRQDGLNTHIKTHSSVKPYVCSYPPCGKAYFHSRSLRKHERSHQENGGVGIPNAMVNPTNGGNSLSDLPQGGGVQYMVSGTPVDPQQAQQMDPSAYMYQQSQFTFNSQPTHFQQQQPVMQHHQHQHSMSSNDGYLMELAALSSPQGTIYASGKTSNDQMPHQYVWEPSA